MVTRRLRNFGRRVWAQRSLIALLVIFEYSALTFSVGVAMTVTAWCWSGYLFCLAYAKEAKAKILADDRLATAKKQLEFEELRGRALEAEQAQLVLEYALGIKQRCDAAVAEHHPATPLSPDAIAGSLELAVDRLGTAVEHLSDPAMVNELLSISSVLMELRRIVIDDGRLVAWRMRAAKQYGEHFTEASDKVLANLREMNKIQARGEGQAKAGTPSKAP